MLVRKNSGESINHLAGIVRLEYKVKIDFREIRFENMDWTTLLCTEQLRSL
jgi:hypothetical protein